MCICQCTSTVFWATGTPYKLDHPLQLGLEKLLQARRGGGLQEGRNYIVHHLSDDIPNFCEADPSPEEYAYLGIDVQSEIANFPGRVAWGSFSSPATASRQPSLTPGINFIISLHVRINGLVTQCWSHVNGFLHL